MPNVYTTFPGTSLAEAELHLRREKNMVISLEHYKFITIVERLTLVTQ